MLKELFNNAATPLYPRKKKLRPLGSISDFVREEMPGMKPDFNRLRIIVDAVKDIEIDPANAALSILDIKMLHNFCIISAEKDERFESLREERAEMPIPERRQSGRAPVWHLTYEDVILNNPPEDMRTFLTGPEGQSEADFYRGHQLIEERLQSAIDALKRVRQGIEMEKNLGAALVDVKAVKEGMFAFRKDLKREHFAAFKPYFSTHAVTQESGPSGAFSGKIPCVDILLFGREAPAEQMKYLNGNQKYFPARDFAEAQKFAAADNIFDALAKKGTGGKCFELASEIARAMLFFRHAHMGTVMHHIGKGGQDSATGNGIEDYLKSRIKNAQKVIEKMELKHG